MSILSIERNTQSVEFIEVPFDYFFVIFDGIAVP